MLKSNLKKELQKMGIDSKSNRIRKSEILAALKKVTGLANVVKYKLEKVITHLEGIDDNALTTLNQLGDDDLQDVQSRVFNNTQLQKKVEHLEEFLRLIKKPAGSDFASSQ